jgi:hypothetical protein
VIFRPQPDQMLSPATQKFMCQEHTSPNPEAAISPTGTFIITPRPKPNQRLPPTTMHKQSSIRFGPQPNQRLPPATFNQTRGCLQPHCRNI